MFSEASKLVGYGSVKPVDTGLGSYSIGPLFADSDQIAEHLFAKLLTVPEKGTNVCFDAYEENRFAEHLVKKYDLPPFEVFVSTFRREVDFKVPDKMYGLTSPCISLQ